MREKLWMGDDEIGGLGVEGSKQIRDNNTAMIHSAQHSTVQRNNQK